MASEPRRVAIRHDVPQIQQLLLGQRVWKRRRRGSVEGSEVDAEHKWFLSRRRVEKIFRLN